MPLDAVYFSGAISNFFSMPLVAVSLLFLVEQQAKVSAPHEVHLWLATSYFALLNTHHLLPW